MTVLDVRWLSLFADVPAPLADAAGAFWAAVTGARPVKPTGEDGEFLPLEPPDGDRYLWLPAGR